MTIRTSAASAEHLTKQQRAIRLREITAAMIRDGDRAEVVAIVQGELEDDAIARMSAPALAARAMALSAHTGPLCGND